MNRENNGAGWQALANAIVEQAAKDYFKVIKDINADIDKFEKDLAKAHEKDNEWIGIPAIGKGKSEFDIFLKKAETRRIALLRVADDCERFFKSEWIAMLTALDGRVLMEKIRKESGYDSKRILKYRSQARKKDQLQIPGAGGAAGTGNEGDPGTF